PIHMTIIFGGMLFLVGMIIGLEEVGAAVLALFLLLKTVVDVVMHVAEHDKDDWPMKWLKRKQMQEQANKKIRKGEERT
ncbi:MAG: DUF6498-containing protein, partial [Candidatus Micrarchaeota archaeon]